MNPEMQSIHGVDSEYRQSNQNSKPMSNQEINKLLGVNINEGRRSKNRKPTQESELARRANQEAL